MNRNIEVKIADDHCPTCDHPIEVFVPQPYASGPELLEALEAVVNGQGSEASYDAAMAQARAAIARAKA